MLGVASVIHPRPAGVGQLRHLVEANPAPGGMRTVVGEDLVHRLEADGVPVTVAPAVLLVQVDPVRDVVRGSLLPVPAPAIVLPGQEGVGEVVLHRQLVRPPEHPGGGGGLPHIVLRHHSAPGNLHILVELPAVEIIARPDTLT